MHRNVNARLTLVFIQYNTEFVFCIAFLSSCGLPVRDVPEQHESLTLVSCLQQYVKDTAPLLVDLRSEVTVSRGQQIYVEVECSTLPLVWKPLKVYFCCHLPNFLNEACSNKYLLKVLACIKRPKESSWKRLIFHKGSLLYCDFFFFFFLRCSYTYHSVSV